MKETYFNENIFNGNVISHDCNCRLSKGHKLQNRRTETLLTEKEFCYQDMNSQKAIKDRIRTEVHNKKNYYIQAVQKCNRSLEMTIYGH